MKNNLTLIATTLLFSTLFVLPYNSFAQAGSLDMTFDTDGKVTTDFGALAVAYSVAIQSDGKILVAGYTDNGSNGIFALVRYNVDGNLDLSFDTDGKVTTPFGTVDAIGFSVAVQSDGKIVVAGYTDNGSNSNFALVRYNTNGSLDKTFDTDGKVTTDIGASAEAYSLAIQNDGKIVLAGNTDNGSNSNFALVRYNTNGSLDKTFDTDGKVTTPFGTVDAIGFSVAIQSDGKIVVAGYTDNGSNFNLALVRYNTDGSLDLSFDTDGKVTTDIGASAEAYSVAIQIDGKIVVAGNTDNGSNSNFALVRYNTNGSLDKTFDTDGKVTTDIGNLDAGYSVAIQSDSKIVVAGYTDNGSNSNFALLRYNTNGSLDNTFDTDGKVTTEFGASDDVGVSIAIQSDGKIVVAGNSGNGDGSNSDFAVVRYNNSISSSINETADVTTKTEVFPNPFSTFATLQTNNLLKNASLTFYNLFGQQVKQISPISIAAEGTISLTRDNLPNGIYFIQLIENNQIISTNKIVITD